MQDNPKVQANGTLPTISVDKTDGIQIFLNEKNMDTQVGRFEIMYMA